MGFHTMRSDKTFAIFLLIISSIVISFGGLVMRMIDDADPIQIAFYRAIFFSLSILCVLAYKYNFKIYKALINVGFPGFIGGIFLAFANIFHIQALANTSIANALFTLSAIPFITAGLAYLFLNEKINLRTIFIMLLAILGIVIMINKGFEEGTIYGNLMALSTALCFSVFTIILRKFRKIDMLPTLVISGFIILIITILLSRGKIYISSEDIFYCFIWGFFLSGIVNTIFIFGTRFLYASEVTFLMLLEFSLGPFWVWLFLNETISFETLVGGIIVMLSVAIYSIFEILKANSKVKRGRIIP